MTWVSHVRYLIRRSKLFVWVVKHRTTKSTGGTVFFISHPICGSHISTGSLYTRLSVLWVSICEDPTTGVWSARLPRLPQTHRLSHRTCFSNAEGTCANAPSSGCCSERKINQKVPKNVQRANGRWQKASRCFQQDYNWSDRVMNGVPV